MKEVVAHAYANTKETLKEVTDILVDAGYEIAYESDSLTNVSIIKEVEDVNEQRSQKLRG